MRFQNPWELDDFLEKGTQLYYSICSHGGCLLLTEIPYRISFPDDDVFSVETKDPFTGMISQSSDNSEALIFTVESALRNGFDLEFMLFDGWKWPWIYNRNKRTEHDDFVIMDSHCRDHYGLSSADGKTVLLKITSYNELERYVKDMVNSTFENVNDVPFQVIPLLYSKLEVDVQYTNARQ